jgi:hypothetical protein
MSDSAVIGGVLSIFVFLAAVLSPFYVNAATNETTKRHWSRCESLFRFYVFFRFFVGEITRISTTQYYIRQENANMAEPQVHA